MAGKKTIKRADHDIRQPADSDVTFLIQVSGQSGYVTPQMSVDDFIKGSKEQFQRIGEVVEVAGQTLVDRIRKLAQKPTECAVEFGISVGGEAGVPFVTKGTLGANFKVTIKWSTK
jgi:hypothetical protein